MEYKITDTDRKHMKYMNEEQQRSYLENMAYAKKMCEQMKVQSENSIKSHLHNCKMMKIKGPKDRNFQNAMDNSISKMEGLLPLPSPDYLNQDTITIDTPLMRKMESGLQSRLNQKITIKNKIDDEYQELAELDSIYKKVQNKFIWNSYNGITIIGNQEFKNGVAASIEFANLKSPYHASMIKNYINTIKHRSYMSNSAHIHVKTKTVETKSIPFKYNVPGFATTLVHEAMHSKLYWDEMSRSNNYQSANNNCSGEFAERKCCMEALNFDKTYRKYMNENLQLEMIENALKTRWWER
ncbi:hypothetical protein ACFL1H_00420 [Nanoarchaeota archaeon]